MPHQIHFASPDDLRRITEIYNQAIAAGNANAFTKPFTPEDLQVWFNAFNRSSHPIYVIGTAGKIYGWGTLSPYRGERSGLRHTAEISFYIDYNHHGRGLGKALISHMLNDCNRLGIKHLLAIMLDINPSSAIILEQFGFKKWGHLPMIVQLKTGNCGQYIYGKNLE